MSEKISVRLVLIAKRLSSTDKDRRFTMTREFKSLPQIGHTVQLAENLAHYCQCGKVERVDHWIDSSIDIHSSGAFSSDEVEKLKEAGWVDET